MDWRETVTNVTENVFPGLSCKVEDNLKIENQVLSSLPLQISLYFNVYLCPIWMVTMIIFLKDKYDCYSELNQFMIITIMLILFIVEVIRLYLGYEGNLRDKTPELAGFWMLSLLVQLPLQSVLLFNPYFELNLVERVLESIMLLLLSAQLITGYYGLKNTAEKQATYYKIMRAAKGKTR